MTGWALVKDGNGAAETAISVGASLFGPGESVPVIQNAIASVSLDMQTPAMKRAGVAQSATATLVLTTQDSSEESLLAFEVDFELSKMPRRLRVVAPEAEVARTAQLCDKGSAPSARPSQEPTREPTTSAPSDEPTTPPTTTKAPSEAPSKVPTTTTTKPSTSLPELKCAVLTRKNMCRKQADDCKWDQESSECVVRTWWGDAEVKKARKFKRKIKLSDSADEEACLQNRLVQMSGDKNGSKKIKKDTKKLAKVLKKYEAAVEGGSNVKKWEKAMSKFSTQQIDEYQEYLECKP